MRCFLSVCLLSTFHWIKIHISKTIVARGLKLYHNIELIYAHLGKIQITLSKRYLQSTSYLNENRKKFNTLEFETVPQHKAFMDESSKNTNYTLINTFLVDKLFPNSDLRRYHSYNFDTSPQHEAFMAASMKHRLHSKKYCMYLLVSTL